MNTSTSPVTCSEQRHAANFARPGSAARRGGPRRASPAVTRQPQTETRGASDNKAGVKRPLGDHAAHWWPQGSPDHAAHSEGLPKVQILGSGAHRTVSTDARRKAQSMSQHRVSASARARGATCGARGEGPGAASCQEQVPRRPREPHGTPRPAPSLPRSRALTACPGPRIPAGHRCGPGPSAWGSCHPHASSGHRPRQMVRPRAGTPGKSPKAAFSDPRARGQTHGRPCGVTRYGPTF